MDDPDDMNDTPKETPHEQNDATPTEPIAPVSIDSPTTAVAEPQAQAPTGRGQQPVTRNQAAIAAAIVVVGIGGFALGKSTNDDRPVAFHGGQQLRGDVGGPGGGQHGGFGGQQGGPGGGQQGGPGGGRQGASPGGRGGPWDQRDDRDRGDEEDSQDNDDGQ